MRKIVPYMNSENLGTKENDSQHIQNLQTRSLIVDAHAFGSFRKDLIHTLGFERTKGFMFRYGWDMGMQDAIKCKENEHFQSIEELIKYGPVMHSKKGFVESTLRELSIKNEHNRFTLEMVSSWKNSYEAEGHLSQIGLSSTPVCYALVGYASGYMTEVCGQKIIFKEISCCGTGGEECIAVGKSESQWGKEISNELEYLVDSSRSETKEPTYEKLLEERDHLTIANDIHKKLMEEVVKGSSLVSIVQDVYKLTNRPVVIHNTKGHLLASAGFTILSSNIVPNELYQYINKNEQEKLSSQNLKTIHCHNKPFMLLTHPIYLQEKRIGYCTFMINTHEHYSLELLEMMIEKVASVCSLCTLYDKTKLDSFDQLKSFLLKEMISGQYTPEEMIEKSSLYQLDLTKPYFLGVISYHFNDPSIYNDRSFSLRVMSAITQYFVQEKQEYLINITKHQINLYVSNDFTKNKNKQTFFEEFMKFLYSKYHNVLFYLGISKRTGSIKDAPSAYREALGANRMASINKQIIFFDQLGIVGTLINETNESDVRLMAKSLLGNVNLASQKSIELIQTLYTFLIHGGNLEKTADELSLSISGLRYRMNKIEDLLNKDIRSPIISSQLLMSIQALIILGELDMKAPII